MKHIFIYLVLFFVSKSAAACAIDTSTLLLEDPAPYYEKSDVVFIGEISSFINFYENQQIVQFSVIRSFKGNVPDSTIVVNMLDSSCSKLFYRKGSQYYIFAENFKVKGSFIIKNSAAFVQAEMAQKNHFESKLTHNKSLKNGTREKLRAPQLRRSTDTGQ